MKQISSILVILIVIGFAGGFLTDADSVKKEPTKASQSSYNNNYRLATTSKNLSKADLAWHAKNTYGYNCSEVVSKREMTAGGNILLIECIGGERLRVILRPGQHPLITDKIGVGSNIH
ncbi:MAG: hypothetical protein OXU44_06470 [Gammaproteobacteria bacterium]|nr:hypothetical protein [Gammaproteobacteria bacterium]